MLGKGKFMIKLKRLNGSEILINSDIIECVEEIPDTTITLVTGNKYIVKEKFDEILAKLVCFRKQIMTYPIRQAKDSRKQGRADSGKEKD